MKELSLEEIEMFRELLTELCPKNWGTWKDSSEFPEFEIGYTISQYQVPTYAKPSCTVLKFDKAVKINLLCLFLTHLLPETLSAR